MVIQCSLHDALAMTSPLTSIPTETMEVLIGVEPIDRDGEATPHKKIGLTCQSG